MSVFVPISTNDILNGLTTDAVKWKGAEINTISAMLSQLVFYGAPASLTLNSTAGDKSLSNIVLPNIPGLSIECAYLGFKYTSYFNSSANPNKIVVDQHIQVKESAEGTYTTGVTIENDAFTTGANERIATGGFYFGNVDVSSEVSAFNKTYNVKWANGDVDQNTLYVYGVQPFLILLVARG